MEGPIRLNVVASPALIRHCRAIPAGTVSGGAMAFGLAHGEALTVAMDALYRYQAAYKLRYGRPLSDDYVLGPPWLAAIQGIRALLNGDGSTAMAHDRSTDSKDNGALEGLFWDAITEAGYRESDL